MSVEEMARALNSRLNFRLVISTLQFLGRDLIFVPAKPAAAQLRVTLPLTLSRVSETPGLSFAHLGGLGNGGWRGALVARRQAPLRGEGLGEGGRGLPAEAGVGAFGVVVRAPGGQRDAGMVQ